MKRILLTVCAAYLTLGSISAQGIKSVEPDVANVIEALQAAGYELFNFDLSSLNDKTYEIEVFVKEADSAGIKEKPRFAMGPTRKFLKDLPEEYRSNFTPIDSESGLYKQVSKMGLYLIPKNDSTVLVSFNFGKSHGGSMPLKLRPLERDPHKYMYTSRPFKRDEFKSGIDIPLMLYGSFWFDQKINGYCFCGDNEIDTNLSTEILKCIPHYYIIGIRLTETN